MKNSPLYITALVLIIIWWINWWLIWFFNFDLVAAIFWVMSVLSRIIYAIVGISAIYVAIVLWMWQQ
ncbi:MAG: hypothetical protein ACD_4C00224G0002 [uncultured bacterium (gcode 4)]|uniref:Uncharacterized protein n=1 Tax=uncultured bacterium (gcode 4) TaxID=1234023 RepID=K2FUM4_9BACT|nr:MAG: hypothetical protein ACD_4C00224G0002 [uncultured bacterium (gcode 4)]